MDQFIITDQTPGNSDLNPYCFSTISLLLSVFAVYSIVALIPFKPAPLQPSCT